MFRHVLKGLGFFTFSIDLKDTTQKCLFFSFQRSEPDLLGESLNGLQHLLQQHCRCSQHQSRLSPLRSPSYPQQLETHLASHDIRCNITWCPIIHVEWTNRFSSYPEMYLQERQYCNLYHQF